MKKEIIGGAAPFHCKMEEMSGEIENIDSILTDPPYLYIKSRDFDKPFDKALFGTS